MKIAVVTDSTAYLTKEEYAEYGIYVLPMSVIFGQETYREEIDITAEEFYAKVKSSPVFHIFGNSHTCLVSSTNSTRNSNRNNSVIIFCKFVE